MYEYKFVEWKPMGLSTTEDYHNLITSYANEGWRFVQIFVSNYMPNVGPMAYELIFERKIQTEQ